MSILKKIIPTAIVTMMAFSGQALADRGGGSGSGDCGCGGGDTGGGSPSGPSSSSNEGSGRESERQKCHYVAYYNGNNTYSGKVYINNMPATPITFTFQSAVKVPATLGRHFYDVTDAKECKILSGQDGLKKLDKRGATGLVYK